MSPQSSSQLWTSSSNFQENTLPIIYCGAMIISQPLQLLYKKHKKFSLILHSSITNFGLLAWVEFNKSKFSFIAPEISGRFFNWEVLTLLTSITKIKVKKIGINIVKVWQSDWFENFFNLNTTFPWFRKQK